MVRSEGARQIGEAAGAAPGGAGQPAPRHVAIIMDGNGRWAASRGLPRFEGHRRGVEAVRRAVRSAITLGIDYLTIYSFSSENWRRPPSEVSELMGLLKLFVRGDLADLHANNVRIRVIGDRADLSPDIASLLDEAEARTRANTGLTLVVAFCIGFTVQGGFNGLYPLVAGAYPAQVRSTGIGLSSASGSLAKAFFNATT